MASSRAVREAAFTLIELMVVMAIMAILASLVSVLLGVAQRQARISATRATLMKVDQALRLFHSDMRVYPWQTDLSNADVDPSQWTNNLAQRLAWKPSAAERADYLARCQADLDRIHGRFVYRTGLKIGLPGGDGSHAFRTGDPDSGATQATYVTNLLLSSGSVTQPDTAFTLMVADSDGDGVKDDCLAFGSYVARLAPEAQPNGQVLSRLAEEICSLEYLAGQLPVEAPTGIDPADPADKLRHPDEDARYTILAYKPTGGSQRVGYRYVPYNRQGAFGDDRRGPVLATGEAQANGWRADYLADAMHRRASAGERGEIDPAGSAILDPWGHPLIYVCRFLPGARGYSHPLRNIGSGVDEGRYGMAPIGRDVVTSLASDIRTTAAGPYAMEFELWSAGPDGRFDAQRDAAVNRDNISMTAFNRDLR